MGRGVGVNRYDVGTVNKRLTRMFHLLLRQLLQLREKMTRLLYVNAYEKGDYFRRVTGPKLIHYLHLSFLRLLFKGLHAC